MTTSNGTQNEPIFQTLPKTIEGATNRYLRSYDSQFRGLEQDRKRLANYAEARILRLRKKAPKFYEEKLPTLVNQAASALLVLNTSTPDGITKFHDTHCQFLRVLDELRKSQPAGDVDFQVEYDRFKEKEQLRKRHLLLRDQIDRMEATEFENDEIGEDEADSTYTKLMADMDKAKVELKRVATLIAKMEGEEIEENIKFELKVVPRSTLEKLSQNQLTKLESLIETFYLEKKRNKRAMYVDKSVIDGMIAQLNIDTSKFTKEDLNHLSKDALDAYRTFFRDIENERRNEYYESLLKNNHLKPKEGIILESPEDVPEDIRQKLLDSERVSQRTLDECFEEFARRPCNEEVGYDEVNDDEGGASGEDEIETIYVNEHPWLFSRVKEEPRDDYENDAPSEDEMLVSDKFANGLGQAIGQPQEPQPSSSSEESFTSRSAYISDSKCEVEEDESPKKKLKNQDAADDDFQMLGVVEPSAKVDVITISDDDD